MAKYIDKSALVAEIERMQDAYISKLESRGMGHEEAVMASISYVNGMKDVIDTLEVTEVDFDAEWEKYFEHKGEIATVNIKHLAKHFFEIGLKEKNWEEERMEECPYRQVGCTMYEGEILECRGACSWVVDYPKLKELKAQRGK